MLLLEVFPAKHRAARRPLLPAETPGAAVAVHHLQAAGLL